VLQAVPFHCWPVGQAQKLSALFQTCPVAQVTQEYPFQLDPAAQLMQRAPFQFCPMGHWQLLRDALQALPPSQVMQLKPFQFWPAGQEQLLA
jgi:hypothetical protein